jgi:hypothetical protein
MEAPLCDIPTKRHELRRLRPTRARYQRREQVLLNTKDYEFTGSVDVQLIEVDGQVGGNNDDRLGTRHVKDNLEVSGGLLSYEAPGTFYTLEYSVFLT